MATTNLDIITAKSIGTKSVVVPTLLAVMISRLVVAIYVLLFILKLRFPTHILLTDTIKNIYNIAALYLYRKVERLDLKLHKTKLDIEFLQTCKSYGVITNFLQFKLYNQNVRNTLTYKSFQFILLNYEISEKNKLHTQLNTDLLNAISEFGDTFSTLDYQCLYNRLTKTNENKIIKIKHTHIKKLMSLVISSEHSVNKDKVVINLSNHNLTDSENKLYFLSVSISHYQNFN